MTAGYVIGIVILLLPLGFLLFLYSLDEATGKRSLRGLARFIGGFAASQTMFLLVTLLGLATIYVLVRFGAVILRTIAGTPLTP